MSSIFIDRQGGGGDGEELHVEENTFLEDYAEVK